jgi:hypothetical protein
MTVALLAGPRLTTSRVPGPSIIHQDVMQGDMASEGQQQFPAVHLFLNVMCTSRKDFHVPRQGDGG